MLALGFLVSGSAHASCGAAFCSASNDWISLTQGVAQGWRIWAQAEYLKQDQLRKGTDTLAAGEVGTHHEEIKTLNRNALLGLEYGFAPPGARGWCCRTPTASICTSTTMTGRPSRKPGGSTTSATRA